jgi:uncharacterized protein
VNEVLDQLWELQQVDVEIRDLDKQREALSESTRGAMAALEAAQAVVDAAHAKTQELKAAQHRHEIELGGKEDEINKSKLALNKADSNKEYQGLLLKIGALQAECGKIEELILLAMETVEGQEAAEAATRVQSGEAKAALTAAEAKVESERDGLDGRVAELRGRREGLSAEIPESQRKIYDRILGGNRSTGTAVCAVYGLYCQGCQMQITPQQEADLVGRAKLVLCRTCGRILILDTV